MMSNQKIIAIVGMPGSGKGTCTDYLEKAYDFPVVHFGNMVYEEVQRRGLDNIQDEIFVRNDMREKEGGAVLAKHAARKADVYFNQANDTVVFDGLYSWTERKFLADKFGDRLLVIAVVAPRKERYKRILTRQDGHRKYTDEQQIIAREISEIEELEKGGPIAFADYTIANDKSQKELIESLGLILNKEHIL